MTSPGIATTGAVGAALSHEAAAADTATVDRSSPGAFYASAIAPLVGDYEARRQAAVSKFKGRMVPGIAAAVVATFIAWSGIYWLIGNDIMDLILFYVAAAGLAGFGAYLYISSPLSDYQGEVRGDVFPKIFRYFGDDYIYRRECPWSVSAMKESDLVPSYDDEDMEDYVRGSYKGVGVELVEVKLTEEQGTDKNRRTVTKFDGLYFVLTPKKKFSGRIVVKRDLGGIGNSFRGFFKSKFSDLERVELEDPEFESQFQVYATDQIGARTVLTTSFMQRLLDLGDVVGTKKVECSFFSDKLLITAPTTHDYFEPQSALQPVDFEKDFNKVVKEMGIVFDIVDTLKLDQDIGL